MEIVVVILVKAPDISPVAFRI